MFKPSKERLTTYIGLSSLVSLIGIALTIYAMILNQKEEKFNNKKDMIKKNRKVASIGMGGALLAVIGGVVAKLWYDIKVDSSPIYI